MAPPAKTSPASLAAAVVVAEDEGVNENDCEDELDELDVEGPGDTEPFSFAIAATFVDGDLPKVSRDVVEDEWIMMYMMYSWS